MSRFLEDLRLAESLLVPAEGGKKLYDRVGGRGVIEKVHKALYDKIFSHSWLKLYFIGQEQEQLEKQQTDFMIMLFGGPKEYSGRMPIDAHEHIMITDKLFELRHSMLAESLKEASLPEAEITDWLRVDAAFKKVIVKEKIDDCKKRFTTDEIVDFLDPCG